MQPAAGQVEEQEVSVPQKIIKSVKSMVEAAKREIEEIEAAEAVKLAGRADVVLVDLRDPREMERDGLVPGAFRMTRGMLEFWIDPESPYFKPIFAEDKKFVFFCAGGLRSALAAKTAQDMGLKPVAHVLGGFKGWKEAGGPVEPGEGKK
jgi:rhodanese-related sulfurtransferase